MQSKLDLSSPISLLPQIGKAYQNKLASIGLVLISDLLYYFPFRYKDLSQTKLINDVVVGENITVTASLWQITKIRTRSGRTIIKAIINDGGGSLDVIWFNQTYLLTVLKPNQTINFAGKVGLFGNKKTLINPKYEVVKANYLPSVHTGRLVPVYSESNGISSKWFRTKLYNLLFTQDLEIFDHFDTSFLKNQNLESLINTLRQIHFPNSSQEVLKARERLIFDELFFLHLRNLKAKQTLQKAHGVVFQKHDQLLADFGKKLPFKLTNSQENATKEIVSDLFLDKPMNRLLQGEVGSGKTIVSTFAMYETVLNNYQVAFLAPTEILATQHYETINKFLGVKCKIALHTSSTKDRVNDFDIVVGTHALLGGKTKFTNLGLIVIDEQQRFGVNQRNLLKEGAKIPHLLTMTATPIPRTLALTIYGNLDISILDEMPSGRKKVKTYLVPKEKRSKAYDFLRKEVKAGNQVFLVCPLIEPSETLQTVKSAKSEYERLKKDIFPELKLELLHGKLKSAEKNQIMKSFKEKKIDLLVATPVVEVGIDIANATVIVIETAERFGLSSLHQLRGRVGRGDKQSYCLLFTETDNKSVLERLALLQKYNDGLKLAEVDLERRGAGDLFGTMQHGQLEMKLAEYATSELIVASRKAAEQKLNLGLNERIAKKLQDISIKDTFGD